MKVTWGQIAKREPRLAALLEQAKAIKDDGRQANFCANTHWYGGPGAPGLKEALCRVVGWEAASQDPVVRTQEAYDVAYDKVYRALPDCRNCSCWGM